MHRNTVADVWLAQLFEAGKMPVGVVQKEVGGERARKELIAPFFIISSSVE